MEGYRAVLCCELGWAGLGSRKTTLVPVIGLGEGHPGIGLYAHLVGCQNYLKHRNLYEQQ